MYNQSVAELCPNPRKGKEILKQQYQLIKKKKAYYRKETVKKIIFNNYIARNIPKEELVHSY